MCCHSFIIIPHVPGYHVSVGHVSQEIDPITAGICAIRLQLENVNIDTEFQYKLETETLYRVGWIKY